MNRYTIPKYDEIIILIKNVICNHCGERIKQNIDKDNFKVFDDNITIVYNCPNCKNILTYKI